MLPMKYRLRKTADFQRVYKKGAYLVSRQMVIYYFPNDAGTRVGFVASKKVGKSVQRNRCKRILREVFGSLLPSLAPSYDFVIVARPAMKEESFQGALKTMSRLLRKARLLQVHDE